MLNPTEYEIANAHKIKELGGFLLEGFQDCVYLTNKC